MNGPEKHNSRHPLLLNRRPLVDTPAVESVANYVIRGIERSEHGLRLDGNTRRGKTHALERLAQTSRWRHFPLSFFHVHFGKHKVTTESYFFTTLLSCAHQRITNAVTPVQHLARVAAHMASGAERDNAEVIVMPVDEAQRLLPEDFEHLHTLDNAIERLGKRLFVVLITQIDYLGNEDEKILMDVPRHAVARFLQDHQAFIPIYRWTELFAVLDEYDSREWPEGSGITYTQHFAPKAFAQGWRFRKQAKEIWTIASACLSEHNLPSDSWAWPMQTLEPFIVYLLTQIAANDGFEGFTAEHIRIGLMYCGFIDFERSCPATLEPSTYVRGKRLEDYSEEAYAKRVLL